MNATAENLSTKYSACETCPAAREKNAALIDTHGTGHAAHAYEGMGYGHGKKDAKKRGQN
jgi:hypothetical protein